MLDVVDHVAGVAVLLYQSVPATFALANGRVHGPVVWQGSFASDTAGISVAWKWGAAVYSIFSLDYNLLGLKPAHARTCLYNNSDHAGTPEGVDPKSSRLFKDSVGGGARGGGGSNWTGSWSGTAGAASASIYVRRPSNASGPRGSLSRIALAERSESGFNTLPQAG